MSRAVADHGGFESGAAIGAIAASVTSAIGLWLANRLVGKAAVKKAMDDGMDKLVDQIQEERKWWMEQAKANKVALDTYIEKSTAERAKERLAFEGEIRNLKQTIDGIRRAYKQGRPLPAAHYSPENPPPGFAELLKQDDDDASDT